MPMSARIVVTASGWVMYGSPLLRVWVPCSRSAVRYARSSKSRSALVWLARTARNSGSRTGLPDWLLVAIRASRARIRRPAGPLPAAGRRSSGSGVGLRWLSPAGGSSTGALAGLAPRSSATAAPLSRLPQVYVRTGRASDRLQSLEVNAADCAPTPERREFDQDRQGVHDTAAPLHELTGCLGGATGGQ